MLFPCNLSSLTIVHPSVSSEDITNSVASKLLLITRHSLEILFFVLDWKRLWVKEMKQEIPESDRIPDFLKHVKTEYPCVYLPLLKGISIDDRE